MCNSVFVSVSISAVVNCQSTHTLRGGRSPCSSASSSATASAPVAHPSVLGPVPADLGDLGDPDTSGVKQPAALETLDCAFERVRELRPALETHSCRHIVDKLDPARRLTTDRR